MKGWLRKFELSLEAGNLLSGIRRLLVGVSSGPDSMALLRLLTAWRQELKEPEQLELLVGHVHHGLRGEEADLDADFVLEAAANLGLEALVRKVDVRAEARLRGQSLEQAARALRYQAFRDWAVAHELDAIALAHHLDDQAETVILRAARGTGLRGLSGMPARRPLAHGCTAHLIRPLLEWRRSELLELLTELGAPHRQDSSNQDRSIRRNFVRHEILPRLDAGVHPEASAALARLAKQAKVASEDFLLLGGKAYRDSLISNEPRALVLSAEVLKSWPGTVLHEAFRLAVADIGGRGLPAQASERLRRWLAADPLPLEAHCVLEHDPESGDHLCFDLRYGLLRLEWVRPVPSPAPLPVPLRSPGEAYWGGWRICARDAIRGERSPAESGSLCEIVDADRVAEVGPLIVRARRPGDRFHPLGSPGSRKLKEFLRDRRVPPRERNRVPIIDAGGSIVWVVGHRIGDDFRVGDATARVLVLEAERATAADSRA